MPSAKWNGFGGRAAYNKRRAAWRDEDHEKAEKGPATKQYTHKQLFLRFSTPPARVGDRSAFGEAPPVKRGDDRNDYQPRSRDEMLRDMCRLRECDKARLDGRVAQMEERQSEARMRERNFRNIPTAPKEKDDPYDMTRKEPPQRHRSTSPAAQRSRSNEATYHQLRDIDKERHYDRAVKHDEVSPANPRRQKELGWCPAVGERRDTSPPPPPRHPRLNTVRHRFDEWPQQQQEKMRKARERDARVEEARAVESARLRKKRTRSPHQSPGIPACANVSTEARTAYMAERDAGSTRHSTPPPSRSHHSNTFRPPLTTEYYHRPPPPRSPKLSGAQQQPRASADPRGRPLRGRRLSGGTGYRGSHAGAMEYDDPAPMQDGGAAYAVDDLAHLQDEQIARLATENRTLKDYVAEMEHRLRAVEESQAASSQARERLSYPRSATPPSRPSSPPAHAADAALYAARPPPAALPSRRSRSSEKTARVEEAAEFEATGRVRAPPRRSVTVSPPPAAAAPEEGEVDEEELAREVALRTWIPRKHVEEWCASLSFAHYHDRVAGKAVRYINNHKEYTCGVVSGVADEDSLVVDGYGGAESVKLYNISNTRVQDAEVYPAFFDAVLRLHRARERQQHAEPRPSTDNMFAH
eukprot:TRINITY_DN32618_c0_g1_i1.p1 TRINITY_DN32618_c0_g1~~TRINITY_DN32618_c0_g1_i1.p1  ORF type:complete len:640 (+),score=235.34 TRINITY_DN32618_c0_g1_i1:63-1982(+)